MSNNNDNGVPYDGSDAYPSFNQNDSYNFNNRIMFCAILFLTFVVLFAVIHHVYTKCVLRHTLAAAITQPTHTLVQHPPSSSSSGPPPKSGLHPLVIASLPMFVISRSKVAKEHKDNADGKEKGVRDTTECPICLNELEDEEVGRVLPNCSHVFHASCIDEWLRSNSTCPVCRTDAEPKNDTHYVIRSLMLQT
ncbi:unnamed protein product [Rhodiola kirilowii]